MVTQDERGAPPTATARAGGIHRALIEVRKGNPRALETIPNDVRALAHYVKRIIDCPPGVGIEDVEQEVLLRLWQAALAWDPKRGTKLTTHAMWCAITGTRKWLHSQRQCRGKRDVKEPSRYPKNFGSLSREEDGADETALLSSLESDGGRFAKISEAVVHYRAMLTKLDPVESAFVRFLVESAGDPEQAAAKAMANHRVRRLAWLNSHEDAVTKIRAVAERLQQAA